jgi:DNA-binding MarR family transcriptional regulator
MRNQGRAQPYLVGALDAIRRIIRVLRLSSRQVERELGIGSAQLFVLQQLAVAPALSINELAERTYTHQSSVSVVVRRLVEQGLVTRRRATGDRRRVQLRLTEAGRRLAARAPVPGQVRLIDGLRALPLARLRALAGLLDQVVTEMGAADEPAAMLFTEGWETQSLPRSRARRQLRQNTSRGSRKTRPARPNR